MSAPALPAGDDDDHSGGLTPEQETWLSVRYRVRVEFLVEEAGVTFNRLPARQELVERITSLSPSMRHALEARVRRKRRRLNELMEGERRTFDDTHIDETDLDHDVATAVGLNA